MSVVRSARLSKLLIFSYVVDWILILLIVIVGAIFALITPNKRPFSLTNPGISFPYVEETVSVPLLGVVALVAPAAIIFIICILLVPGPTVPKSTPKQLIFQRKLWEWHTGWLGLALSQAAAFLITSGMKNLFGKPRPDLLDRCQPDIPNLSEYSYSVWGAGNDFANFNVVSAGICTQTDSSKLNDGFRSFPSGHASFASGGLVYLSLFLASKLAITIPFLAAGSDATRLSAFPSRTEKRAVDGTGSRDRALSGDDAPEIPSGHDQKIIAARNQAAGPPIYLLVIVVIPFFASVYITASRYSDFRHDGFDLSFGFMLGAITSLFAFRYYHLPINQGAGWSWGPRSRDRAFWAGVGVGNYAGDREPRSEVARQTATGLEAGAGVQGVSVTNDDRIELLDYGRNPQRRPWV
ncbi:hypothetical protein LZ554_005068 [Drepanopeziza brunnea f. sp. 'monogermtubi']|nr:hypothetical protein LZ554_005068 [Drepanopeziza brunnea f. sp. 'monogermtubi']